MIQYQYHAFGTSAKQNEQKQIRDDLNSALIGLIQAHH